MVQQQETLLPGTQNVALLDALDRVLASAVAADRDQPPFHRSTRDGFAGCAAELNTGLPVHMLGQVRAGEVWTGLPLQAHEAVEIMTGAPVPAGADCVVMVEHVLGPDDGSSIRLEPGRTIRSGENIVPEGSEARAGEMILPTGVRMGAAEIALAASCGCATLEVFRRVRVAILPTGDELVEVAERPLPHQIRNSNSYALAAAVTAAGGEAVRLPVALDSRDALLAGIRAAEGCDLLLLTGGVSMGKYDLVEEVLLSLDAEFFFTGVRMQPGKPVVFGRLPAKGDRPQFFFGLPGNPVSTQVCFLLFVLPLLRAMSGSGLQQPNFVGATLEEGITAKPGLTRFLPALLTHDLASPAVRPVRWQGSGDQAANARANCYVVVPEDKESMTAGEHVTVLLR